MHLPAIRVPLVIAPGPHLEQSVTHWLERALRLEGVIVHRSNHASLEFRSPAIGQSMLPASEGSLRTVASGVIEVVPTAHGLEVIAYALPRTWPLVLPLIGVSLVSGMIWNPEFRLVGAIAGVTLAGAAWLSGYWHLRRALRRIAANIQLSYQDRPALPRPLA